MTFDEWIDSLNRFNAGAAFSATQRNAMRMAWDAARNEVLQFPTYAPKPLADDGCKPFDSQAEIAKLRGELEEIRSTLEMLKSPVYVAPSTPPAYDLIPGELYRVTCGPSNEIEPEVAAGEGFGGVKVTDFRNWRNSKGSAAEQSAQAFQDRYEQLKVDGMDSIDAFRQALDERHGRKKPNFPGY